MDENPELEQLKQDRGEYAVWLKHHGYNCCMAVLMAYIDEIGLPEDSLRRLGVAFGTGMGGMNGNCGALIAAEMILGWKEYEGKPLHAKAREVHDQFLQTCGATVCRTLKGVDTGTVLCSCEDCIRAAVHILEGRRKTEE